MTERLAGRIRSFTVHWLLLVAWLWLRVSWLADCLSPGAVAR